MDGGRGIRAHRRHEAGDGTMSSGWRGGGRSLGPGVHVLWLRVSRFAAGEDGVEGR